jgi:hypothetical protein
MPLYSIGTVFPPIKILIGLIDDVGIIRTAWKVYTISSLHRELTIDGAAATAPIKYKLPDMIVKSNHR